MEQEEAPPADRKEGTSGGKSAEEAGTRTDWGARDLTEGELAGRTELEETLLAGTRAGTGGAPIARAVTGTDFETDSSSGSDSDPEDVELSSVTSLPRGSTSGTGVISSARRDSQGEEPDALAEGTSSLEGLLTFCSNWSGSEGLDTIPVADPWGTGGDLRAEMGDLNLSHPATLWPGDPHHRQVPSLLRQFRSQCPALLQYLHVTVGHLEIRCSGEPQR